MSRLSRATNANHYTAKDKPGRAYVAGMGHGDPVSTSESQVMFSSSDGQPTHLGLRRLYRQKLESGPAERSKAKLDNAYPHEFDCRVNAQKRAHSQPTVVASMVSIAESLGPSAGWPVQ